MPSINRKYITYRNAATQPRPHAQQFAEDRTCVVLEICSHTDRQTDRHAYRNTPRPECGRNNEQQGRRTDRETETYNERQKLLSVVNTRGETQLYSLNSNIIMIIIVVPMLSLSAHTRVWQAYHHCHRRHPGDYISFSNAFPRLCKEEMRFLFTTPWLQSKLPLQP